MLLWVTLFLANPAPALPAQLAALRGAIERKAWTDAARLVREFEAAVVREAPLSVTDGRALREPAAGLGIYQPLPNGRVLGEELFLYAQVQHHGLRQSPTGFELHLVSDLIILDQEGNELARDEAFGESRYRATTPHRDTFVNIALRVVGLSPGAYRARLVVHDRISGKKGTVEIPFRMP